MVDRVTRPVIPKVETGAVLSEDGRYRYHLTRAWDWAGPVAVFVMLNPSTADDLLDDATVRRCIGYGRAWECGRVEVVNLFAHRTRSPKHLAEALQRDGLEAVVGPHADLWLAVALENVRRLGGRVVAAWGANGTLSQERASDVLGRIRGHQIEPLAFGEVASGHPRHPLYLPVGAMLHPYQRRL